MLPRSRGGVAVEGGARSFICRRGFTTSSASRPMEGPMGVEAWWGDGMRRGLSELRDTRQHWYDHISGFDAVRALWFRVCPGPPRELYRRRARESKDHRGSKCR